MELQLPKCYLELDQEEMMYIDGGKYGYNGVSYYWNYARIFLNRDSTRTMVGITIAGILGFLGASAGPFAGAALGSIGFVASSLVGSINSGIWFDVNYYLWFTWGDNWGWQ